MMEKLNGNVYDDVLLSNVNLSIRRDIYLQMTKVLAELHCIKPVEVGLEDFGKTGNYIERQISRWSKQWTMSKQREIPEMNFLIDWLFANIPDSDETTIVHGDFRLGNLIFKKDSSKIIAVLDWELSTLGHPLADLGYMLLPHFTPIEKRHGLKNFNLMKFNIPEAQELVKVYCEIRNMKIFNPIYYIVFSMFRSAAILEGVFARGKAGNASSSDAEKVGKESKPLAETAWGLVQTNFRI